MFVEAVAQLLHDALSHAVGDVGLEHADRTGDEAQAQLTKAAQVDPPNAGKYYFNLGAVSEAIGDLPAARDYYEKASSLSPKERHYRTELNLFRRRNVSMRK